jgi:hypothetical protein
MIVSYLSAHVTAPVWDDERPAAVQSGTVGSTVTTPWQPATPLGVVYYDTRRIFRAVALHCLRETIASQNRQNAKYPLGRQVPASAYGAYTAHVGSDSNDGRARMKLGEIAMLE